MASIQNKSSRDIKLKYCLYAKYSYFARGRRKVQTKDILKEVGDPVPPSAGQTVTRIITIPPTTCVSILNCNILKVEYRLRVCVSLTKPGGIFLFQQGCMIVLSADCVSSTGLSGCQVWLRPRDQVPHSHPACFTESRRRASVCLSYVWIWSFWRLRHARRERLPTKPNSLRTLSSSSIL